jgi:ribbon-helix-helix CopG family protein
MHDVARSHSFQYVPGVNFPRGMWWVTILYNNMRKSVTLTLTLPTDLLRELDKRCKLQDLNRSQLIRKTIRAYKAKQDPSPAKS